jgi:hypothetical protein
MRKLGARVRHVDMGRGDDLDLRLQKLGRDSAVACLLGFVEEFRRHLARDHLGLRIDQEILFLHTERERAGHAWTLLLRSCCEGVVH